ncbi:MAG: hypothetical protein NT049_17705 [Planctomycetota bacterium]|nr:hypothetical protein [Planctomycetota bacterium]
MYLAHLPKVRTKSAGKVYMELWDGPPSPPGDKEFLDLGDVVFVHRSFDFSAYWQMAKEARKRAILEVIREEMLKLAARMGWAAAPFETAYQAVLEKNLVHEFFCGKPSSSPDRQRKARIWCSFDVDEIKVYAIIYDRSGKELQRKLVTTTWPHDFFLHHALGTFDWLDDRTLVLAPRIEGKPITIKVGA